MAVTLERLSCSPHTCCVQMFQRSDHAQARATATRLSRADWASVCRTRSTTADPPLRTTINVSAQRHQNGVPRPELPATWPDCGCLPSCTEFPTHDLGTNGLKRQHCRDLDTAKNGCIDELRFLRNSKLPVRRCGRAPLPSLVRNRLGDGVSYKTCLYAVIWLFDRKR